MKNYTIDGQTSEAVHEVVEKLRSTFFKHFIKTLIANFPNLTQQQIGDAFGVTKQYISLIKKEEEHEKGN